MASKIMQAVQVTLQLLIILNAGPASTANTSSADDNLRFQILHATSKQSSTPKRVATLVNSAEEGSTPALLLNAGDTAETHRNSGSISANKWKSVAELLTILQPNATSPGSDEYNNGEDVLAANLYLADSNTFAKSTVFNVNGKRVGIIGYVTKKTKSSAKKQSAISEDEIEAISAEVRRLKKSGVNILIALGHSGFTSDQKIAAEVEDIDLVIGSRTNGGRCGPKPKPTTVSQSSGRIVYVVQPYANSKYLGHLSLTFDVDGELINIVERYIFLDSSIEQATVVLEELDNWTEPTAESTTTTEETTDEQNTSELTNQTTTIVGSTRVRLNGNRTICRREECNLGNLIADAMIAYNSQQYNGSGWTDAAIAVVNSGTIGSSITTENNYQITRADVAAALPYGDKALTVAMTGEEIMSMLEWSVYNLTEDANDDLSGAFLQYSGIQVIYDLSQPANSKVVSAQVRCANCTVPTFSALVGTNTYSVIVTDYMYSGGDGYTMLSDLEYITYNRTLNAMLVDYLEEHSPIYPGVEWRITFE